MNTEKGFQPLTSSWLTVTCPGIESWNNCMQFCCSATSYARS